MTRYGTRWFAALWDRSTKNENSRQREGRREVVSGSKGRVLELGFGVGTNWQYLPEGVDYQGIEPSAHMLKRARRHAADESREVALHQAPAESLPFPDASFDTVLVTLTLCSVADLARSLSEARRVLRVGGELRFWEHVRPSGHLSGRAFDLFNPVWRLSGEGCNLNRRSAEAIAQAGFEIRTIRRFRHRGLPTVLGVAVKPEADAPAERQPPVEVSAKA